MSVKNRLQEKMHASVTFNFTGSRSIFHAAYLNEESSAITKQA